MTPGLTFDWRTECSQQRKVLSRSHDAVIRVYDGAGNVIETHKQAVASSGGLVPSLI